MTKKPVVQPQDKYVLRLPDGLRDRIKAYAERHGRTMNSEIVRVLEREYPEPWSLEERFGELLEMLKVLKAANSHEVERFTSEVEETMRGMIGGRVEGLTKEQLQGVRMAYESYSEQQAKTRPREPEMQDDERKVFNLIGETWKFSPRSANEEDSK